MSAVNRIIAACWISFLAYWIISAISIKRRAKRSPEWGGQVARTSIFILVFLAMRLLLVWHPFHSIVERYLAIFANSVARCVGAGITVLGIVFAIWARSHLGRNWGQPMTLRQGHELVTTGPYALVRHPIYTGMIFAFFGTALAANVLLLIPFAVLSGFFILSAMMEEKHMLRQFPDDYPEYTRRTKMLIPYVL